MDTIKTKLSELFFKTFHEQADTFAEMPKSGSSRRYFRIGSKSYGVIGTYNADLKENNAFYNYTQKFLNHGINVPKIFAFSPEQDIYLQEDLGNTTLFDIVKEYDTFNDYLLNLYKETINQLITVQIQAGKNINYDEAYPRSEYDKQSMMWDLSYFKYMFVKPADISFDEQLLENDFNTLADFLITADKEYFMYRDFQSRNIMIKNHHIYFIDYQGGRKGALQYDLASLLYDAKANIPEDTRTELKNYYLENISERINIDKTIFDKHYYGFSLIRIMQAMGAYGYRGLIEKKQHFIDSIPFAMKNVQTLLQNNILDIKIPELLSVLEKISTSKKLHEISGNKKTLKITVRSFSYMRGYPYDKTGNGGGFVFDCRFLENPGRLEQFKDLCGKDKAVIDFLEDRKETNIFLQNVQNLVFPAIEKYKNNNFTNISIDFGCTGGQHRSVYFAEKFSEALMQIPDIELVLEHTNKLIK